MNYSPFTRFICAITVILLALAVLGSCLVAIFAVVYLLAGWHFAVVDPYRSIWAFCWYGAIAHLIWGSLLVHRDQKAPGFNEDGPTAASASTASVEPTENLYIVCGGVYTDLTFAKLDTPTLETYGPYPLDEAIEKWHARSAEMLDAPQFRLRIIPYGGQDGRG